MAHSRVSTRAFRLRVCVLALAAVSAFGCLGGQSRVGKLQEAAQTMNMATRFGRMDVATEHVAAKQMEDFAKQHANWGGVVRIADLEYRGMRFVDEKKAIVSVAVAWQRVDEQELRVTEVAQVWDYDQGKWKLVDETRTAGDVGLLGEPTVYMRPERREDVHFPSVTIR
jgi:hypothetical protein